LAASTLARPELADALRVGSLFLFFITFGSIVQQALGGFEDFKATSLNGVLRAALSMAFAIPLAWVWGLYGALWGMALASLFTIPQAFLFLWRQQRRFKFPRHITLKEAFSEYPILYHFALPGFLMLAVMTGANWLGRVFLLRERGFADVGLFEAAGQWVMVVSFAPTVLSRVVLPILSSTASDNARESYQRTLSLQLQTVLLLTGPATILMIALCHWVTAVYGQEYAGTDKLMPVLFFTAFLRTVTETFRISYESKGRQWSGLTVYIVWALVFLGSAAFLTREWGAMGFALAGLAGQTALLAISAWQVHFQLVPGFLRLDGKLLVLMSAAIALSCVAWHALPLRAGVPACLALCVLTLIPLGTRLARANRRHNPIAILKNFLLRMPLLARWRTP
jgi:O-antigen/teichoic acid export membrane protein